VPGEVMPAGEAAPGALLEQRLQEDIPIVELCQKPEGGTPLQCPLSDCPCRSATDQGMPA